MASPPVLAQRRRASAMKLAPDRRFVPATRLPMEAASTSTGLQLANAECTGYDTQPYRAFVSPSGSTWSNGGRATATKLAPHRRFVPATHLAWSQRRRATATTLGPVGRSHQRAASHGARQRESHGYQTRASPAQRLRVPLLRGCHRHSSRSRGEPSTSRGPVPALMARPAQGRPRASLR